MYSTIFSRLVPLPTISFETNNKNSEKDHTIVEFNYSSKNYEQI